MIGGNNPNDVFFDCVGDLVEVQLIEKWIGLERLSATTSSEMFYINRVSLFIRCIMVHLVIIRLCRGQTSDMRSKCSQAPQDRPLLDFTAVTINFEPIF